MRLARGPAQPEIIDHELQRPREGPPEEAAPPIANAAPSGERSPSRRWARRGLMVVCWSVLGFAVVLLVSVMLPNLFGMRNLTVLSGSMEPTIHTGDVVVEHQIPPLDAQIGDVVSFKDPEDPSVLITHRVQDIQVHNGVVAFVTKGDANTGVERWKVSADGMIGRVDYHVWRLGYLLAWIRGRMGRVLLVVLPALFLGAYELLRIWRPKKREVPDEAPA
jgi:signal peptidase